MSAGLHLPAGTARVCQIIICTWELHLLRASQLFSLRIKLQHLSKWFSLRVECFIIRPDVRCGLRLKVLPSYRPISNYFFLNYRPSKTKRNSTKSCRMCESECDLKMHVQYFGCPLPLIIGALKHPFSTVFGGKFVTPYIFETKHYTDNRRTVLKTTKTQNFVNFGPQTPKIGQPLLQTLRKLCILHRQTSHMEVSKRNSTKLREIVE